MAENTKETADSVFMDAPKTNGSTAVRLPSNGISSPELGDRTSSIASDAKQWPEKRTTGKDKVKKCLGENILTLATLLGVAVGIGLGVGLRNSRTWTKREIMYVNFPGEIFLSMLKCLILPLIVSSLIAAVGSLDTRLTGKIGLRAVGYYLCTTVLAIILGIILVSSIRPGVGQSSDLQDDNKKATKLSLPEDTMMDLIRNMFPPNIMEATIKQSSTDLKQPLNIGNSTNSSEMRLWDFTTKKVDQTNILGVVVFSIVLGITLASMKKKGRPLLDVFITLSDAMMIITKLVIWLSPLGVLFLVTSKIMEMEDLGRVAGQIGMYAATVLAGVLGHGFLVLPIIFFLFTRKNPFTFIVNMGQALATAFGTASSAATLPVTISCLEDKNNVDHRVSRFCLPIGATINMDGTALYEAVAAIFIAQVRGISLSIGSLIAISITSTAASIGAAGIPQAGLVTMVMVLNVVGLPEEDVALILVVDWILDRFRTLVNVLGDAFGSAIVDHYSKNDLAEVSDDISNLEMTTL
uniref:Amino acid transporter n=1 Tax=Cupiennius salei TaxID=6928 RepID=A0A061QLM1_CUPSA